MTILPPNDFERTLCDLFEAKGEARGDVDASYWAFARAGVIGHGYRQLDAEGRREMTAILVNDIIRTHVGLGLL